MILKITIKKKWFDMILSGDKKTEYRELKPYWIKRLFNLPKEAYNDAGFIERIQYEPYILTFNLKDYTHIQFFNGGCFSEKLPNITIEFTSLYYGPGVENWGAEKGKEYLSLCLGQITEKQNC